MGERTEMVLRPSSGVLVRRTRSRWSTATSVFTSERTELLRTISRPGRWVPVAEVVRREYARRPDQAAARPVPPAGPGRTGSATLTVTVLRAIRTPTREVHQIRTLRVEPGQAGAPGSVGSTGPAGPATIHTNTVLARHPTPATPPAGPVHATPVSVLTPANPAPETGPGWADEHIEEVAARVLRSIERRAVAQRERLGRG